MSNEYCRLTALQETGLYDLIVNDNAFGLFYHTTSDGNISIISISHTYGHCFPLRNLSRRPLVAFI